MSKDCNIRHGKDSRNVDPDIFYGRDRYKKEEDMKADQELNEKIEKNYDSMLDALLKSDTFKKLLINSVLKNTNNQTVSDETLAKYVLQDGIYPRYCKQNFKILFIGRDAHGLIGYDYTWSTWGKFKEEKKAFNRTVLSIAYYFSTGKRIKDDKGKKKPVNDIVDNCFEIFDPKDPPFSFACINASKIDRHGGGDYKYDEEAGKVFVNVVGKDLMKQQVDIIDPDIIIGANLLYAEGLGQNKNYVTNVYDCKMDEDYFDIYNDSFYVYEYTTGKGKTISFFDSIKHFSRLSADEIASFIENLEKCMDKKGKWPVLGTGNNP